MPKFRKKVEAFQYLGLRCKDELAAWMKEVDPKGHHSFNVAGDERLWVETTRFELYLPPSYWIVYPHDGDFGLMPPNLFEATYEPVEDDGA